MPALRCRVQRRAGQVAWLAADRDRRCSWTLPSARPHHHHSPRPPRTLLLPMPCFVRVSFTPILFAGLALLLFLVLVSCLCSRSLDDTSLPVPSPSPSPPPRLTPGPSYPSAALYCTLLILLASCACASPCCAGRHAYAGHSRGVASGTGASRSHTHTHRLCYPRPRGAAVVCYCPLTFTVARSIPRWAGVSLLVRGLDCWCRGCVCCVILFRSGSAPTLACLSGRDTGRLKGRVTARVSTHMGILENGRRRIAPEDCYRRSSVTLCKKGWSQIM